MTNPAAVSTTPAVTTTSGSQRSRKTSGHAEVTAHAASVYNIDDRKVLGPTPQRLILFSTIHVLRPYPRGRHSLFYKPAPTRTHIRMAAGCATPKRRGLGKRPLRVAALMGVHADPLLCRPPTAAGVYSIKAWGA